MVASVSNIDISLGQIYHCQQPPDSPALGRHPSHLHAMSAVPTDLPAPAATDKFGFKRPPEMDGPSATHPVVVVGAGPVGLTMALSLAKAGIACVLLEDDDQVCTGSRALGMSRRTLEIWEALGAADRIRSHGRDWFSGRSFYQGQTILDFRMPDDDAVRHRPMFNIQQCHTERYLVDALARQPLAELRWQSRFLGLAQHDGQVTVQVGTPEGEYSLKACYVVACDGARSAVRSSMGLRLEGTSYEATYVIADIRLDSQAPMERRCWFDPPSNPGLTILMHGQPDKLWRLDYQLGEGEDAEEAVKPANVMPRLQAHLDYIGEKGSWTLEWLSPYKVHSRALERFRHQRVLFAGDAAHLMPIFGIRGLNSGVEDAWNLGWKLAQVVQGKAPDALLDAYDTERRAVFAENSALAERNAWFMTPPDAGVRMMRDAVLSLALDDAPVADILNPKQASYVPLRSSALSTPDTVAFTGGPLPGEIVPDLLLRAPQSTAATHLQGVLDGRFALLCFAGDGPVAPALLPALTRLVETEDIQVVLIHCSGAEAGPAAPGITAVADHDGVLHQRFGAEAGHTYLARPDHHIAARWKSCDVAAVSAALAKAKGMSYASAAMAPVHAPLSHSEQVYRTLGKALAAVPTEQHTLFLSKLAMLLALEQPDTQKLEAMAGIAARHLAPSPMAPPTAA
ncbi:MAG: FAD-dependent oxidoreductase [Polaromonas sp.]|nr:FAD-dependent oxidoreductase [Polaromonas sp.]